MKDALQMLGNVLVRAFRQNTRSISKRLFVVVIIASGFSLLASSGPVSAAINNQINYQGKLTNNSNAAVSDGAYSIVFSLYTVASGGSNVWTETQSVTVTNGLFSVMLGTTTPLSSVNFNQTLYLGVNVAADGEMTPRKIIGTVPAAFVSSYVSGSTTPSSFGTTTPIANTQVTIEATSTTAIPLALRAATGQTANLFQIQDASTANLIYVNSSGALFASSTLQVTGATTLYGTLTSVSTATSTFASSLAVTEANATSTFAGGVDLSDGCFALDGVCIGGSSSNWTDAGTYLTPLTATDGILINAASSTITNLTVVNATTTNATTTNLYVSDHLNLGTTTQATSTDRLTLYNGSFRQAPGNLNLIASFLLANAFDIVVSGPYAYSAGNDSLTITDISNPPSPTSVSTVSISGAVAVVVAGHYAYVAHTSGMSVVDISNPSSPIIVGTLVITGSPDEIDVSGSYAYVTDNASTIMKIVNVSDPTKPILVGTFSPVTISSVGIKVVGRYAYVIEGNDGTLKIIDISNAASSTLVGTLTGLPLAAAVDVVGRYAYVITGSTDDDLEIIDISNPASPTPMGSVDLGSSPSNIIVAGRYAYVTDNGTGGLKVIDVASPASPVVVSTLTNGIGSPQALAVAGRYAYVLDSGKLRVIDLSGIEVTSGIIHSLEAGRLQVRQDAYFDQDLSIYGGLNIGTGGIYSSGPIAISMASSTATTTDTLSLTGGSFKQVPRNPGVISGLTGISDPTSVFVSGRYAYVTAEGSDQLKIVDISNVATSTLIGSLTVGGTPSDVYVSGRYAYVIDDTSDDLKVIDISNPSSPTLVGSVTIVSDGVSTTGPQAVKIIGPYAYVIHDATGPGLKVINISNPKSPVVVGSVTLSKPEDISIVGNYAYVPDSTANAFYVIDISQPSAPALAGSLALVGGGVLLRGDASGRYVYQVDGQSNELIAIDVSNPATPTTNGSLEIGGSPTSIDVAGRYAYVVDQLTDDIKIIDVASSTAPILAGSTSLGGSPVDVFVSGRYAYVVDDEVDDLKIIDLSGMEVTSAIIHSLEAGSLQVREGAMINQGLSIYGGLNIGSGGIFSSGPISISVASTTAYGTASTSAYFQGNVGVGTTTPWLPLSVQGAVALNGLTSSTAGNAVCILAGGEVVNAGANTCATSAFRFKENIETLPTGFALSELEKLRVVAFDYKEGMYAPEDPKSSYGLIAEEVELVDRNLVDYGYDGLPISLKFEKITGLTIQAIQELNLNLLAISSSTAFTASTSSPQATAFADGFFSNLFDRIKTWLADVTNGIEDMVANTFQAKEEICIGETCIDEDALKSLLLNNDPSPNNGVPNNQTNQQPDDSPDNNNDDDGPSDSPATTTPEVIEEEPSATTTPDTVATTTPEIIDESQVEETPPPDEPPSEIPVEPIEEVTPPEPELPTDEVVGTPTPVEDVGAEDPPAEEEIVP